MSDDRTPIWERWRDVDGTEHLRARLTPRQMHEMSRESREMLADALWLANLAIKGERTEGPLSMPQTGMDGR